MAARRPVSELRDDASLRAIQEFADLVVASARSSVQRERIRRAVDASVTAASLTVLRLIERSGPLSMSEAAGRLQLDQSTLSRQVRPLLEGGLLLKGAEQGDRRVTLLRVSPKGRNLLQRMRDVALHDYDTALMGWPAGDRAQLGTLIERLRHDLLDLQVDPSGWSIRGNGDAPRDVHTAPDPSHKR